MYTVLRFSTFFMQRLLGFFVFYVPKNIKISFVFLTLVLMTAFCLIIILTNSNFKNTFRLYYRPKENSTQLRRGRSRSADVLQYVSFARFDDDRRMGNRVRPVSSKDGQQINIRLWINPPELELHGRPIDRTNAGSGVTSGLRERRTDVRMEDFFKDVIPISTRKLEQSRIHTRKNTRQKRWSPRDSYIATTGYTVPNATYFKKATTYFTDWYNRVRFIVSFDDLNWTREHVTVSPSNSSLANDDLLQRLARKELVVHGEKVSRRLFSFLRTGLIDKPMSKLYYTDGKKTDKPKKLSLFFQVNTIKIKTIRPNTVKFWQKLVLNGLEFVVLRMTFSVFFSN